MAPGAREETVRIGDAEVAVVRAGRGAPLLVLHEELGHPGWLAWHADLAESRSLVIPLHPGFGRTPRIDWIRSIRDLACFYARLVRAVSTEPIDVIGFSLGGWIAAEMAANDARQFRRMALVAPAGIRPPEGEILDLFISTAREYLDATVHDPSRTAEFRALYGGAASPEQFEAWEDARAETARLAWAPYLYNPSLAHLLAGIEPLPTLVLWGRNDRIIPAAAGDAWRSALSGAELVTFENCGHRPEIEDRKRFVETVRRFFS